MAGESFVNVTEGSGKKLHTYQRTIGANTVEDEVVLMGEPYLPTYTLGTGTTFASWATDLSHVLQLMAGSTLNVYLRWLAVYLHAGATAAAVSEAQIVRLTTAGTGGTTFTPAPNDTGDAAAGFTMMTLPTVKGTEGSAIGIKSSYFLQTTTTAALGVPRETRLFLWDWTHLRGKGLRIAAGITNGIAIKVRGAVAGCNVSIEGEAVEASF